MRICQGLPKLCPAYAPQLATDGVGYKFTPVLLPPVTPLSGCFELPGGVHPARPVTFSAAAHLWWSRSMPEWLTLGLIVVGYIVLMGWVLPRLGVPT